MKKKKIIFMGTADFSAAVLQMLIDEHYNVVAVVSQPDRPVGRKKVLQPTLVKQLALQYHIPCIQPSNIKSDYEDILDYKPDLIISAAYGQIIPSAILDYPSLGCINVHASLLPKLRGGAPVHYAIMEGMDKTGITIMYMAKKMDAGDMLAKVETPITKTDTVSILYDRLTHLGASLLKEILPDFMAGKLVPIKQNEDEATFAPTITREKEHVLFNRTCYEVDCHIRGLNDWPVGYAIYNDQAIKLWSGEETTIQSNVDPGTIVKTDSTGIYIACNDYLYCLKEIQIPGKKKILVKDYMNGKNIFELNTKFM